MGVRWGWGRPPLWGRSGVPLFPWDPPMCRPPPPIPSVPLPDPHLPWGGATAAALAATPPTAQEPPPCPTLLPGWGALLGGGPQLRPPRGPHLRGTHTQSPHGGGQGHMGDIEGTPVERSRGRGGVGVRGGVTHSPGSPLRLVGGPLAVWGGGGFGQGPVLGGPPGTPGLLQQLQQHLLLPALGDMSCVGGGGGHRCPATPPLQHP